MSRIHEALKRAEQEKAAGLENKPPAEQTNAIGGIVADPPLPLSKSLPVVVPQTTAPALPKVLRFEELWERCVRPQWKPDPKMLVFGNSQPFAVGAEQFRTLRSRLYKIRESHPLKTVLISSAIPGEGKTSTATNLAQAIVRQQGCRVLLVDADLRAPRTHILLGAPPTPGLADYLQNGKNEFDVIQRGPEEGFCFLPAGNHVAHPSELISSNRMRQFLELVHSAFDWIIIDSPPVLPVADTRVLTSLCDGLIFVVHAASTQSEVAQKAVRELRDAKILGVVLNQVSESEEYGKYYGYGKYGLNVGK